MDGAVSVITLVSVALSSVRVIYETVSGVKNAPQTIQQMTSNLHDLSDILQQLLGYGDNLYLASELPELVRKCVENMKIFETKLGKLTSSKDNRMGRLWKNVKATLQEKDLDRMSTHLQQHLTMLSLQVNLLERKCLSSHTASLDRIEALSNKQDALNTTNSGTLESTRAGVDQIHDSVKNIGTASQTSSQNTRQNIEEMGDKIQNLAGLSAEQSTTLNAILELLKQKLPTKSQQTADENISHEGVEISDEIEMENVYHADGDGLQDALDRLCRFAKEKEKTIFSAEANSVICDIEQMLGFLSKPDRFSKNENKKRKAPCESESDGDRDLQYQHEVKRFKGLLNASHCVAINEKIPRPWTVAPKSTFQNAIYRQSSRNGNFTVRARRQILGKAIAQNKSVKNPETDELEIIEGSIIFLAHAPKTTQIAITFQQRNLYEGSILRKPVLSFSALLPKDSKVFSLIESGDLNSLMKMFILREACLSDRDLDGRSLLNYALEFAEPDICKFFIDEGADVDFVELDRLGNPRNDSENDPEIVAIVNQCRRFLFEAGADPTISDNDSASSFLSTTLSVGTAESLSLLLNHGLQFIQTDSCIGPHNLLHELLRSSGWTLESVALILRLQENSKLPAQNLNGCLHYAVCGSGIGYEEGWKNVLVLLIKAGANVYDKDCNGNSVSDLACGARNRWVNPIRPVRRTREIWAEALDECGYNAEEVMAEAIAVYGHVIEELSDTSEELSDTSDAGIQTQDPEPSPNRSDRAIENLDDDTPVFGREAFDRMDQSEGNLDFHLSDESNHLFQLPDESNHPFQSPDQKNHQFHPPDETHSPFQLTEDPNYTFQPPISTPYNNYDYSFLDEDANVWRN